MEKDFPEETKTNVFLEEVSKETALIQDPEAEEIENETYSSLEEYFLDCCRDGFFSDIFLEKTKILEIGLNFKTVS